MSEFIKYATEEAMPTGHSFLTQEYNENIDTGKPGDSGKVIAIPAGKETQIKIDIRNPQGYDLNLEVTGDGKDNVDIDDSYKHYAILTINNPERLDQFDLTISGTFAEEDRQIQKEYKLPKMEARFFDNTLSSLSVTTPSGINLDPSFDSEITFYTAVLEYNVASVIIAATLPGGKFSSFEISGADDDGKVIFPSDKKTNDIEIIVTADCGITKVYTLRAICLMQVTGIVSSDVPNVALAGLTVYLKNSSGFTVGSSVTASDGKYSFINIPFGTGYTLEVTKYAYTYTPESFSITADTNKNITMKLRTLEGAGTTARPYLIYDDEDLMAMAILVNNSNASYGNKHYRVMANIDISAAGNWTPIGNSFDIRFDGVFDGRGHGISDLKIDAGSRSEQGLFGVIGDNARILNVALINVDIKGGQNTGGIAGNSYTGSSINNCFVTGTITGADRVGGIVGKADGWITDCYNRASVSGNDTVGGISGWQCASAAQYCYNAGTVSGLSGGSRANIGGITGAVEYSAKVNNNASLGLSVNGAAGSTGRIVGLNNGTLEKNYARNDMSGNTWSNTGASNRDGESRARNDFYYGGENGIWRNPQFMAWGTQNWIYSGDQSHLPHLVLKDSWGTYFVADQNSIHLLP